MPKWMEETKQNIKILKERGYFDSWKIINTKFVSFHLYPNIEISKGWIEKRTDIYIKNAEKLKISPPLINFFIYPSIEVGKQIGITPATSFIKSKEIHGHLNQSPGHELTHILLGEINSTDNLPANGLWSEGICVYLDGTNTDRRKHTNSLNYPSEIFDTPWINWRNNLPGNLYPLAGSIIQYLNEKFGWNLILEFIKNIEDASDEELIQDLFKSSYENTRNNWLTWLKENKPGF